MKKRNQFYHKILLAEMQKSNRELEKQWKIMNGCAVITLWELYGWRKNRINSFALHGGDIWEELSKAGSSLSALELCEKETGMELSLDGVNSYHNYSYLDHNLWDGRMPSYEEAILIEQKRRPWIPVLLMACFCTALHRKEKWGYERLTEFVKNIDGIRKENHDDKYFVQLCKERYDIDILIEGEVNENEDG